MIISRWRELALLGAVIFATSLIIAGVVTARFRKDFEPYGLSAWPYALLTLTPLIAVIFYLCAPSPKGISLIISDSLSVVLFGLLFLSSVRYLLKAGGRE